MTIGFLHTAATHVPTFRALSPDAVHAVDASLLADARATGLTADLLGRIDDQLRALAAAGVSEIVCTCSSIGGAAEERAAAAGVPVLRVDRPMAAEAVAAGSRIAVVHSVASTLAPTSALLTSEATRAGVSVTLLPAPCLAAWAAFEQGDLTGYADQAAAAARRIAPAADVIVLAQASLTPAADLLTDLPIPVLTSPGAFGRHIRSRAR